MPDRCHTTGKVRWETRKDAKRHRARVRAIDKASGKTGCGPAKIYRCPYCGSFHIGHSSQAFLDSLEQRANR